VQSRRSTTGRAHAARPARQLAQSGVELIFARVSPYLRADMERHRIAIALGEARIFATLHEAVDSARVSAADAVAHGPDA
jgi:hypothetical protein